MKQNINSKFCNLACNLMVKQKTTPYLQQSMAFWQCFRVFDLIKSFYFHLTNLHHSIYIYIKISCFIIRPFNVTCTIEKEQRINEG